MVNICWIRNSQVILRRLTRIWLRKNPQKLRVLTSVVNKANNPKAKARRRKAKAKNLGLKAKARKPRPRTCFT
jgi:hypothetical protein